MCYDELREAIVDMCGEIASDTKVRLKLITTVLAFTRTRKKREKLGGNACGMH